MKDRNYNLEHSHNWQRDRGWGQIETAEHASGSGVVRNREHDAGLHKEIRVWKDEIAVFGGRVVKEWNSVELQKLSGERCNAPMTQAEKRAVAEDLGFGFEDGKIQIPDHRLEIEWADGRREVRDLEHLNERTYRPRVMATKAASGARISVDSWQGRRVKDGPDVLTGAVTGKPTQVKSGI